MSTLIITHSDVVRLLDALPLLELLRAGFVHHSSHKGPHPQRARAVLHDSDAALVVFPGTLPDIPAYTVKVHARFPDASPRRGVVNLFDQKTGALLAILDAEQLTAIRTGVSAAISADVLAREDASFVAILGAGRQASVALRSLRLVRSLRQVRIHDPDIVRSEELALRTFQALKLPAEAVESVEEAVDGADIVLCDTGAREPILFPGMVSNGCHVISLGAEDPGKLELSPSLIRQSRLFTDDRVLAASLGSLAAAHVRAEEATELGEVIAGTKPGRTGLSEITLYAPVGLPFQDLAAAWLIYERAKDDEEVTRVELGQ